MGDFPLKKVAGIIFLVKNTSKLLCQRIKKYSCIFGMTILLNNSMQKIYMMDF